MTKNVKCFICKKGWLTIESRSYKSVKFYRISPTCRGRTDETDGGKIKDSVERKKAAKKLSSKFRKKKKNKVVSVAVRQSGGPVL